MAMEVAVDGRGNGGKREEGRAGRTGDDLQRTANSCRPPPSSPPTEEALETIQRAEEVRRKTGNAHATSSRISRSQACGSMRNGTPEVWVRYALSMRPLLSPGVAAEERAEGRRRRGGQQVGKGRDLRAPHEGRQCRPGYAGACAAPSLSVPAPIQQPSANQPPRRWQ